MARGHLVVGVDSDGAVSSIEILLGPNKSRDTRSLMLSSVRPVRYVGGQPHGARFCGVRILLEYLRAAHGIASVAALRRFLEHRPSTGPAYLFAPARCGAATVIAEFRRCCGRPQLHLSGHSLRVTAITTLSRQGCSDDTIMRAGAWKTLVAARRYRNENIFALRPLPLPSSVDLTQPTRVWTAALDHAATAASIGK